MMNETTTNKGSINEKAGQIFEVVNQYVLTRLELLKGEERVMSMQVNHYEKNYKGYEFTQTCQLNNGAGFIIKPEDLVFVKSEYNKKADTLSITCELKSGMEFRMTIINMRNSRNEVDEEGWNEIDVYALQEFLDDVIHEKNDFYCILTRITDVFGFDIKMHNPMRTYINTLHEEWLLHIGDDFTTLEVPVVDDSVNLFYMKETEHSKEIIVKPYGQPFMEIKMLFFKKHNKQE